MRNIRQFGSLLICAIWLLGSGSAHADDGMTITIFNNTTDDLLVTAYDRSYRPARQVLVSQAISGNASVTVLLALNASGLGSLSWTAVTKDSFIGNCGHGDASGLHDGDTVNVRADGHCKAQR